MVTGVITALGCNEINTAANRAIRVVERFIGEFGQGIPVAIVHEENPDTVSVLADRLKRVCGSTHVIVMSSRIGYPTRDADREYDAIIPYSEGALRDIVESFLDIKG